MPTARKRTVIKAAKLAPVSFSGTPKVASVVFASPYVGAYSVTVDVESTGGKAFAPSVTSISTTGFTIGLNVNSLADVVGISWQAIAEGE